MKFEFDHNDLSDSNFCEMLRAIAHVYHPIPVTMQDLEPVLYEQHELAGIKPLTFKYFPEAGGCQAIPASSDTIMQNIIYDESGPSCPGAISSEGIVATIVEEVEEQELTPAPAKLKGRPRKSVAAQAAELVEALKVAVAEHKEAIAKHPILAENIDTSILDVEVPATVKESLTVEEDDDEGIPLAGSGDFDLMSLASPSATKIELPVEQTDHQKLVDAVRALMFDRGHVWMRNVLEKHKKIAKSTVDFPDEILQSILDNPDVYEGLV